ncbi:hypothetical protein [Streptomyces luteolus]|uniref:Uncharacterized protein n=1 Tax=Streptomyces luteolus TaxID=3043615 RepID=A0ABT6SQ60_9ACTN|nr:hypothetical protein [Streptomyces sp. B-S-A12]MDI3417737.1 hypothetical protein [Streptomyces sp. B-S-A12]
MTVLACSALVAPLALYAAYGSGEEESPGPAREPTRQERSLLHRAEQILLRDCMRERGFTYRMVAEHPVKDAREFPYVIDDVAWAREHGHGTDIQRKQRELRRDNPNQRYFQSLSPERRAAALEAANGARPDALTAKTPDGMRLTRSDEGCQAEAERRLYGDLAAWFQARSTLEVLPELTRQRVLEDSGFATAVRPWARCMRAAGHSFDNPAEVRKKLAKQPLPRNEEIRLAVAEAQCAHSSGLAKKVKALQKRFDTEFRQRFRSEVNTGQRLQLAAIPRARSIVEKSEQGTETGARDRPASDNTSQREES